MSDSVFPGRFRAVVYVCFFASGAAGLIYEVIWARQLTLFLGVTSFAHTAVITSFMAGLAGGALFFGRLADRRRDHIRVYAVLEAALGVFAALTPNLFRGLERVYAQVAGDLGLESGASQVLRFGLALVALAIPTFLMGGTLPLLVRGLVKAVPQITLLTSRLYGLNTVGATVGAFMAGYVLLPSFGVRLSVYLTAALNLAVAVVAWRLYRSLEARFPATRDEPVVSVGRRLAPERSRRVLSPVVSSVVLIGFAISGFAALVYQLSWIRVLNLVVGSSVYGFSATLTTFLAGLGLGSLAYHGFLGRRAPAEVGKQVRFAGALEMAVGLLAVVGWWLVDRLPDLFLIGVSGGWHRSFFWFQAMVFGLCAALMLPPTLLLGALFPLVTGLWTRSAAAVGRGVGLAYAVNTGGTILGSLAGGLLLLPVLGVRRSLLCAASLQMLVGGAFWIVSGVGSIRTRWLGLASTLALFVVLLILTPPWDRELMTSGVFFQPERALRLSEGPGLRAVARERELLYYSEGRDGVVVVVRSGGARTLLINGKPDASSSADLPTQVLLAQIPLFFHPDPRDVLVIGMGSGVTAGSATTHSSVESIEIVEISKEVVEATRYFALENLDVLKDDRVEVIIADARSHLLSTRKSWDVIISEPSNPWLTGVSNLFTLEAFELSRSALRRDGIMAQWFHTYNMTPDDLRSALYTFQQVYPYVTLWSPSLGDLILLGSNEPQALPYSRIQLLLGEPAVADNLRRIQHASADAFALTFLLSHEGIQTLVAGAVLNTDDRPHIEFNAPRSMYRETSLLNMRAMINTVGEGLLRAPIEDMVTADASGLEATAFGLRIDSPEPLRTSSSSQWLVGKAIINDATSTYRLVASTSRKLLTWKEADVELTLQASWLESEISPQHILQALRAVLGAESPVGDVLTLPCGEPGLWGAVLDQDRRDVAMAVVWKGVGEFGHDLYVAFRRFSGIAVEDLESAAVRFASRFRSPACSTS